MARAACKSVGSAGAIYLSKWARASRKLCFHR